MLLGRNEILDYAKGYHSDSSLKFDRFAKVSLNNGDFFWATEMAIFT